MYCGAVTVLHATHATRHLTQHEHHFLNDMGCMTWGDQPAFLAYSTFFNISAASGAKQKCRERFRLFQQKRGARRGGREEETGKERQRGGERKESLGADRGKQRMEGVKKLLPGFDQPGEDRDSFNSAYIFILNDRYPQGRQRAGKRAQGMSPGPKTNRDITVLRSSTFQGGFLRISFMARGSVSFQQR